MTHLEIGEYCENLVAPHKLLYVCVHGSKLYGTDTPTSDSDYKGVFLPNPESCFVEEVPHSIKHTTGDDDSRNGVDDIDIDLWSVQHFLSLLAKGDSNALSVYFSAYNHEMVVYVDQAMIPVWETEEWLYDPFNVESFTGFARGQAAKYGIKGDRLQVMKNIMEYLQDKESDMDYPYHSMTLGDLPLVYFIEQCNTEKGKIKGYMSIEYDNEGREYLKVLNKQHSFGISLDEFARRMLKEESKYGKRATEAMEMDGHDWKALSHSVRTYMEALEMLHTGKVLYPLKKVDILKSIKAGEWDIDIIEHTFNECEAEIERLKLERPNTKLDKNQKNRVVLDMYRKVYTQNGRK